MWQYAFMGRQISPLAERRTTFLLSFGISYARARRRRPYRRGQRRALPRRQLGRVDRRCRFEGRGRARPGTALGAGLLRLDAPGLESGGYGSVRAVVREFVHEIEPKEFIRLRTRVGSSKQRLDSMTGELRGQCIARARERLSELPKNDFTIRMSIIFTSARKPDIQSSA